MTTEDREHMAWLEELSEKAELVQDVQDKLAGSPEFQALAGTYEASFGEAKAAALKSMADYAVLFASEKLGMGR